MTTESDAFKKRMQTIKVPDGFTAEFSDDPGFNTTYPIFTLKKEDDTEVMFHSNGSGHTRFKVGAGWRTFDRTGVEDSFYHVKTWEKDETVYDLNKIVEEQLAKIAERREYYKTAIAIPGLPGGFTVAPDGVDGLKKRLNGKAGHLSFTPSGFGTGYLITKKPTRGCRFGEARAKPELEAFLGHSPLYVSTMDCD